MDIVTSTDDEFLSRHNIEKSFCTHLKTEEHLIEIKNALDHFDLIPGGAAANTAHALSALGANTSFLAKISDDHEGLTFLQNMKDVGVTSGIFEQHDTPLCTPQVLCFITPDGDRTFASYNGVALDYGFEHMPKDLLGQTDILYLDGYTLCSSKIPDAFLKASEIVHDRGGLSCLNVGDRSLIDMYEAIIRRLLNSCDGFICNLAEAQALYGSDRTAEGIVQIMKEEFKFGAITNGSEGAYIFCNKNIYFQPSDDISHIKNIDSIGAGDHFSAAILYGIAHGMPLDRIGKLANACAVDCLSHPGGRPLGGKDSLKHLAESV